MGFLDKGQYKNHGIQRDIQSERITEIIFSDVIRISMEQKRKFRFFPVCIHTHTHCNNNNKLDRNCLCLCFHVPFCCCYCFQDANCDRNWMQWSSKMRTKHFLHIPSTFSKFDLRIRSKLGRMRRDCILWQTIPLVSIMTDSIGFFYRKHPYTTCV